jgi:NAD(P)-dependent dehydrogenase (short-subunit alcohol dehydrogenase family)
MSKISSSLIGKNSIVTGASGYFGSAFSEELLRHGSNVILFDKDDSVKSLSAKLTNKYGNDRVTYYIVDFYDDSLLRNCLEELTSNSNTIDVLINNAFEFSKRTGFNDPSGRLSSMTKEQWMRSFDSGIYWHALMTQFIADKMKSQKSGSIINISSMYATVSPDPSLYEGKTMFNPPSYGATKAGLLALTKYVASFYGEFGVRCNSILAGAFPHIDIDSNNKVDDIEFLERLKNRSALKRIGVVEDLLGPMIFLASDASKFVTGHGLAVDGGWTIT